MIEREFVLSTSVLGDDYSFLVTDDTGSPHEVGPLVDEVLSVRRSAAALRAQPPAGADPNDLWSGPLGVLVMGGIEIGVVSTVRMLYGDHAAEAFRAHCDEVESFLEVTDTARH